MNQILGSMRRVDEHRGATDDEAVIEAVLTAEGEQTRLDDRRRFSAAPAMFSRLLASV